MRVILADDSVLFREGIAHILTFDGVEVIAQVGDAASLVEAARRHEPDAVVVDVRMPPTFTTEGLDAATAVRSAHPDIAILVLSQYVETRHAIDLIGKPRGGVGYLLKERVTDITALRITLERIVAGESVLDPEVVAVLLQRRSHRDALSHLSRRELDVLALMAEGHSNERIASTLFLSTNTVETHIRNVFMKFDLPPAPDTHRRVLAVVTYLRR